MIKMSRFRQPLYSLRFACIRSAAVGKDYSFGNWHTARNGKVNKWYVPLRAAILYFILTRQKKKTARYTASSSFESLNFPEGAFASSIQIFIATYSISVNEDLLVKRFRRIFQSRTRIECTSTILLYIHKEFMGHPADTALSFYESKIRNKMHAWSMKITYSRILYARTS